MSVRMQNKVAIILFVIFVTVILFSFLVACNDKEGYDLTKIGPVANPDRKDHKLHQMQGIVRDTDYRPLKNVSIFFGEDNKFVQKTDEKGGFYFCFYDPYKLAVENQLDYLTLGEGYDCVTVLKKASIINDEYQTNEVTCYVVAAKAEDNFDIRKNLIINDLVIDTRPPIFFDIRIATDGVRLPEGYLHREQPVAASETSRCDYTLNDVTVYVNGKYYAISNSYGIGFDFLLIGMEITFEYEGFDFAVSLIEPPEKEDQDNNPTERNPDLLNDNTLIIQGLPMEGAKIFAYTDDLDILIK